MVLLLIGALIGAGVLALVSGDREPVDPELLRRHGARTPSARERHAVSIGSLQGAYVAGHTALPTS